MTDKYNELYQKAKSKGFLTLDELNMNYADSDTERIELVERLNDEGIPIIFKDQNKDINLRTDTDVLPTPTEAKAKRKSKKIVITNEIEEPMEDTKPKGNKVPKLNLQKEKEEEELESDDLDIEDSDDDDDYDSKFSDFDKEEYADEDDSDDDESDEEIENEEEDLDELNDEEFYNSEDEDEVQKYEYDNFDDLIYSQASLSNTKIYVSDPVKMYLKEIGRINLLTPEAEKEIAKVIYDTQREKEEYDEKIKRGIMPTPEEEAKMKERVEQGEHAKKTLIEANLRLVVNIAKHFNNADMEFADLIQEGSIGLSKAVTKFDYTRGNKFSTYATGWIKQAITRAIADQARTIRIPVHMNETINKLNKKERDLSHDLGRKPTFEELADAMGITVEKLMMIKRVSQKTKSLEDPVGEEDDSSYGDFVPDNENPNPEEYTANEALKREINTLLSNLSDREERVIKLRFGLIDGRTKTLEEVGKEFGVTRERIRQIEAKALRKLRHPSRSNKLRDFVR